MFRLLGFGILGFSRVQGSCVGGTGVPVLQGPS